MRAFPEEDHGLKPVTADATETSAYSRRARRVTAHTA